MSFDPDTDYTPYQYHPDILDHPDVELHDEDAIPKEYCPPQGGG
jgi:hypothetical protein